MPKPLPLQLPGWEFSEIVAYAMPNGRIVLLLVRRILFQPLPQLLSRFR